MKIEKKFSRDVVAENSFEVELFKDKTTGDINYLDRNRQVIAIAKKSDISGGGGSSNLTTTVTVTAAEFIAVTTPGDVVKNLLPSPGAGKFILLNSVIAKFKDATIAFNSGPAYNAEVFNFGLGNLGTTPDIVTYVSGAAAKVNQSIDIKLQAGSAPTAGDGNIVFEIEYQILDF